jgi:iron(III) transport system substrate-binding protein
MARSAASPDVQSSFPRKPASIFAIALVVLAFAAGPASAADPVDVAAAKKEGKVVWYTSMPIETAQKLATLFQQTTGIAVELFRSGGSNILRRFQQEAEGGKTFADVLTHSEPAAARAMARKGMFTAFKATDFDKVPNEVKDPDGFYVAQRLNVLGMYLRGDRIAAAEQPRNWVDLTRANFAGKMVMADPSFSSLLVAVVGSLAKDYGWEYFEKIRRNDILLVQGNQQVADMVKRGERSIAVGADAAYVGEARATGMPISTVYPEDGAFLVPSPSAIVKGAPHPNAAKAFADFMLSRAVQELLPREHLYSARLDIAGPEGDPPLGSIKIHSVDYDYIEAESTRIKKRFAEVLQ